MQCHPGCRVRRDRKKRGFTTEVYGGEELELSHRSVTRPPWNMEHYTGDSRFPSHIPGSYPDPLVVLSPAATGGKSRDVDDAVTDVTDDSTDSQSMCDARAGGPCRGAAATGWRVSLGSGSTRPRGWHNDN